MSRNEITVTASPQDVFDVLDDAEAYPGWVVGARRMRRVDSTGHTRAASSITPLEHRHEVSPGRSGGQAGGS